VRVGGSFRDSSAATARASQRGVSGDALRTSGCGHREVTRRELDRVSRAEHELAGQHLVGQAAQAIQVGAPIDARVRELLGRHVRETCRRACASRLLTSRAIPKSISTTRSPASMTFDGLRSRWTMPCSCAAVSPAATARAIPHRLVDRELALAREPRRQRLAGDELHLDEFWPSTSSRIERPAHVGVRHPLGEPDLLAQRLRQRLAERA